MINQTNFDTAVPEKYRLQAKLSVKDEYTFEYALKSANKPMGVATYKIYDQLPENMKDLLPAPEEITERLKALDEG